MSAVNAIPTSGILSTVSINSNAIFLCKTITPPKAKRATAEYQVLGEGSVRNIGGQVSYEPASVTVYYDGRDTTHLALYGYFCGASTGTSSTTDGKAPVPWLITDPDGTTYAFNAVLSCFDFPEFTTNPDPIEATITGVVSGIMTVTHA